MQHVGLVAVCGILVPRPGIEPRPPALGAWSPNHWNTPKIMYNSFFQYFFSHSLHLLLLKTYILLSLKVVFFFHFKLLFLLTDLQHIIRSYLTSSKPRYSRSTILNIDDSKDISVLIKSTSLSLLQYQILI